MKTTTRMLCVACIAAAAPAAARAQATPAPAPQTTSAPAPTTASTVKPDEKLAVGKWTGTVTPPNGDALDLEFNVTAPGDTTKMEIGIPAMGMTLQVTNIKLEKTTLTFGFLAGDSDITCKLEKKEDASYAGQCADSGGSGGPMTMVPPKKGTPTP